MLIRVKLITITITTSGLLLLFLCLGSQNLSQRKNINLGITSTAPLPTGFTIGISSIIGIISGGFTTSLLLTKKN